MTGSVPTRTAPPDPTAGGLTTETARQRLEVSGPNALPEAPPTPVLRRVLRQLGDPMILLLLGAFVVVVVTGDLADATIIAVVVVLNTAIGVVQEVRAESAIEALGRMSAPRATVVRDGVVRTVVAAELVADDLVVLDAGAVVPADLVVTEAAALMVDEAAMTGESVPVSRDVDEELLAGTVVTGGRARGRVVRTGAESGLGQIAALVAGTVTGPTPLQQRLSRLSRTLVGVTTVLCLVAFVSSVARGEAVVASLILAVSLGVAAIPESLPAVVSVALALGAHRMAQRSAVVRWLPAVETLGSVDVLASDKTGTLTEGRMEVSRWWTPKGPHDVGAPGLVDADRRLLRDVVLCNDARLGADGTVVGEAMEGALLTAAAHHDVERAELETLWPRTQERPFDATTRSMTTWHAGPDGAAVEVTKGAPEVVLELVVPDAVARAAHAAAQALAEAGFRVIAVAEGDVLVGLVAVADPPRAAAAEVVAACRAAGIRMVLITGDHPATARAIAEQVGIVGPGSEVVDGDAVARGEHVDRVDQIDVYARTRPEQKVAILDAWREHGAVVAMTGDGVNDAPALRRADIGVAMGGRGTEVARQAADLVLADDDLRTLVAAVAEGRRVYRNIRTFLRYALAGGLAEVLVILVAPLVGMGVPLTPAMILWINMLTHGVPGVAFGGEPLDPADMEHPSPRPARRVLDRTLTRQVAVAGLLITAVSFVAGWLGPDRGVPTSTAVFVALGFGQLSIAMAVRAPRHGVGWRGRGLEAAVVVAGLLQVAAVLVPPLRDLVGAEPVELRGLALVVLVGVLPGVVLVAGRALRGVVARLV